MATPAGKILPAEYASKIGHIKTIESPHVQRLIQAFEKTDMPDIQVGEVTDHLDLEAAHQIENVVAIDGSFLTIPNSLKRGRRLAFLQITMVRLKLSELREMRENPIVDPRDHARRLKDCHHTIAWPLPLSGIAVPDKSVLQTVRELIDEFFILHGLYEPLNYLISRMWMKDYIMHEHMACIQCGQDVKLPRNQRHWNCKHCGQTHTLADYLQLVQNVPTDWAGDGVIAELTSVAEHLLLLGTLIKVSSNPDLLAKTLFVKDGPLVLRSQLSRLVFAVRAYFDHLRAQGLQVHYVGVEKTGELVDHLPMLEDVLKEPGDFFLPSVKYLQERIKGVAYNGDLGNYRSQYGNKVVVRLGKQHIVAFTVPTGEYRLEPKADDLIGFQDSMRALSEMLSSAHENALVPLILANQLASISENPSKDILQRFAERLLSDQKA